MEPPLFRQRRARYMPKRRENLHPAMVALIGRVFDWRYAGTSHKGDAHPGQARWILDSKHAAEVPTDAIGLWASDEDLERVVKT
jgi:hypothetical protein